MAEARAVLGVDVGGTFTDAVLSVGGRFHRAKVPTAADQSQSVMAAAEQVIAAAGIEAAAVTYFAHGMTTATNALLERKGARTASLATSGFGDLLEIGRQDRPRLYDACPRKPPSLVPRELRFTVRERVGAGGVIEELTAAEAERVAAEVAAAAPAAVAVCLLFSFLQPEHERRLGEELRRRLPGVHVSLSSEVLPQFREYERFSTTAVDAYLTPVVARYLEALAEKAEAAGLPAPAIMQSSGGVLPLEKAAASAALLLLSGPAAGVVGAIHAASASGAGDLITFDMGGTSTDVSLVRGGEVSTTTGVNIGGCPVALPMVDIHTIGAGGGSIAWVDAGGALRVGPTSAGAEPGPACYGRGGEEPTVTDADICLGYLGEQLGGDGGMALDKVAAETAIDRLAAALDLSRDDTALGIRRVANANMVKAIKVISVERGHDPREFTLVAFGGAGPMHAAELAQELEIRRVLVPGSSGVLSALGMVVGDQRRDWVRTVLADCGWDEGLLEEVCEQMAARAHRELPGAELRFTADVRYQGQSHELGVELERPVKREQVEAALAAAHEQAYGFRMQSPPELVNIRLAAVRPGEAPAPAAEPAAGEEAAERRLACFDGEWLDIEVRRRGSIGADGVTGPLGIEEGEATTVVPPGWKARGDAAGNLWLERS